MAHPTCANINQYVYCTNLYHKNLKNATYWVWLYKAQISNTVYMEKRHPNLVKIGKLIREARKAKGYSQEAFAAEAGLGRTYMGRIERGEQNISIQNLILIAISLKTEVSNLIPSLNKLNRPKKYT